jgi:hypothetical protein
MNNPLNPGTPNYDSSLTYQTYCQFILMKFYLEKSFVNLDKIQSDDIHNLSPIARIKIR